MYSKIDPNSEVKTLPTRLLFTTYVEPYSDILRLNTEEMKELLASMTHVYLNEDTIVSGKYLDKEILLGMSIMDELLIKSVREYILKMLNQMHSVQNDALEELILKTYDRKSLFENDEIKSFCYENIIDDLFYTRVVDFGNFLLEKISQYSFMNISRLMEKQFFDLGIKASKLTEHILNSLVDANMYEGQVKLAIKLYHYKYNPKYDELRSYEFGQNVILDNIHSNMYCKKIKEIIEYSYGKMIEQGRNNNLENNRGW